MDEMAEMAVLYEKFCNRAILLDGENRESIKALLKKQVQKNPRRIELGSMGAEMMPPGMMYAEKLCPPPGRANSKYIQRIQ